MKLTINDNEIELNKELNKLDLFVIKFIKILKPIRYVIISGYQAIFFGRTRNTEDIDLFIEQISFEQFEELFEKARKGGFWCVNGDDIKNVFEILKEGSSIRFAKDGEWVPNIEIKFARDETDFYSLKNPIIVRNSVELKFGPIELQIAYKLLLGSSKDIEDAKHLYHTFKKYLNAEELNYYIKHLKVEDKFSEVQ